MVPGEGCGQNILLMIATLVFSALDGYLLTEVHDSPTDELQEEDHIC